MRTATVLLLVMVAIMAAVYLANFVREWKTPKLQRVWRAPLLGVTLTFAFGYLMTVQMCGLMFFTFMQQDGRCTTDWPAEVFFGTTLLAAVVITPLVTVVALWRIFTRGS